MNTRNINVTLEKAREWYNSGNAAIKEIALQAFSKNDLEYNFKDITSFKAACKALGIELQTIQKIVNYIARTSKASAAMFKLNIIRKALNMGQDLHLNKNPEGSSIWIPYNPLITPEFTHYKNKIQSGDITIIGKVKSEEINYYVLNDTALRSNDRKGLGRFCYYLGKNTAGAGFLGCATKEIAEHFGEYFGMLITEAKYGDIVDFKIISRLYYND